MTLSATIFKCHQRSQITKDTVEPICMSEKLLLKHAQSMGEWMLVQSSNLVAVLSTRSTTYQ